MPRAEVVDAGFLRRALRTNPRWLRILQTARHYRKLPCKFLGYRRDPDVDFLLTMALEMHDADLCECGCGYYRDICQSDDMDGRYEVVDDEVVCHAKAPMDAYRREAGKREVEDGALVWVRPVSDAEGKDPEDQ